MSNFTEAELSALRRAYASGTLRVEYDGRSVTYDSAEGLLSRIRELERDLGAAGTRKRVTFAGFGRGY